MYAYAVQRLLRPLWKAVPRLGVGISDQSVLKCWSAWKAVLSAAIVTGGAALGNVDAE